MLAIAKSAEYCMLVDVASFQGPAQLSGTISTEKRERACSENFHHFQIMSCSREKTYQALPAFLYCKRWESWAGPGNEAVLMRRCG